MSTVANFTALQAKRLSDLRARQRATRLAFHLSNARIELEAIERMPRTGPQDVAVANVRRALLTLEARTETLQAAFPGAGDMRAVNGR
jgi:hypothetical protein